MNAKEMTNEEIANWMAIIAGSADVGLPARYREYLREAAARLRAPTIRSDNSAVIAELERRLKVAEGAMDNLLEIVGNVSEYLGMDCGTMNKVEDAKNALAAIREEK